MITSTRDGSSSSSSSSPAALLQQLPIRGRFFLMAMVMAMAMAMAMLQPGAKGQLSPDFYDTSCPNLSAIVSSTFQSLAKANNVVSPSTLRLLVHDCFIQGCDGSILISSTPTNVAERDYVDNDIPQQAFNTVGAIKVALESVCPGVVSCADIVVLAAREAVAFLGGPSWEVALGRRDSRTSLAGNGVGNIPQSNLTVDQLISLFLSKGLDASDLVALSGAHTIGFAKCRQFTFRMLDEDPFLNSTLAQSIRQDCPQLNSNAFVPLDAASPFEFDNSYYKGLQNNMGLLLTDQALSNHPATKPLVDQFASSPADFFQSFVDSVAKMSAIGVLTGDGGEGEIRSICTQIN